MATTSELTIFNQEIPGACHFFIAAGSVVKREKDCATLCIAISKQCQAQDLKKSRLQTHLWCVRRAVRVHSPTRCCLEGMPFLLQRLPLSNFTELEV